MWRISGRSITPPMEFRPVISLFFNNQVQFEDLLILKADWYSATLNFDLVFPRSR